MFHRIYYAISALIIFCLTAGSVCAESVYYPLLPNVRYVYRVKATTGDAKQTQDFNLSAAITTMKSVELHGKTVIPQKYEVAGEFSSLSYVTEDDTGIYFVASQLARDPEPELTMPFQYLIHYPIGVGTNWVQKSSEFDLINNNQKLPVTLHAVIESTGETVTVPSGSFSNCLKVKMTGTADGEHTQSGLRFEIEKTLWYAPGVGMIKSLQKETRTGPEPDNASLTIIMLLQSFG